MTKLKISVEERNKKSWLLLWIGELDDRGRGKMPPQIVDTKIEFYGRQAAILFADFPDLEKVTFWLSSNEVIKASLKGFKNYEY